MSTPLQSTQLTADELTASIESGFEEEHEAGEESHVHLPNPSLWPLILTIAIVLTFLFGVGIFYIQNSKNDIPNWLVGLEVLSIVGILVSIMGWALEDPNAPRDGHATSTHTATSYEEASTIGKPTALAEAVLQQAEDVVDRLVTVSSVAWSAHPVQVEVEREGVVLALYGKVELETQKKEVEGALLKLPGVIDVRNFIVAEDALLNTINARIEELKASGKVEGTVSVLVENYIVNLYGEVAKAEMKDTLERALIDIPGVKVVVNRIGLKDTPGDLGKTRNKVGK